MRTDAPLLAAQSSTFDIHWRRWTFLFWLIAAAGLVIFRWKMIHWFTLPDTDDNMRMMQVRGLLAGQGWYDLRQHALNPPYGANIHWSRLVDLPIAGLTLLFKPLGLATAERIASAIAPLLPLLVAMLCMGAVVRRLISPIAYPFAVFLMLCAYVALNMFMPMRIDHHGWQLALLVMTLAGLADDQRGRGGVVTGLASAASLTIGLEMIAFLALAGAIVVLRWVYERQEAVRLKGYALSLALGCAFGYVAFASIDNRAYVCDALSPVWLSVMVGAGALAFALSLTSASSRTVRFGLAAVAGIIIAAGFVHFWPDCLGRPEHVSAEVDRIWLSNVREAKPIFKQDMLTAWGTIALPIAGLIGTLLALWQARGTPRFSAWAAISLFMVAAFALLIWQVRMGPATQLVAIPGAVVLTWIMVPLFQKSKIMPVRVLGTFATFLFVSGIGTMYIADTFMPKNNSVSAGHKAPDISGQCFTIPAMAALNALPAATVFTHVDLSPRLITLTHHRAIMGPYHRNGEQILDVYHAFGRTPEEARMIMTRHGAALLLTCPHMSETTVYKARWPKGFYAQLDKGQVPDWLTPVALPKGSPFKLWAIKPQSSGL
jgi:hypothetical protein